MKEKQPKIWSWFHRFTYVSVAWVLGVFPNHSIQQWFLFPFPSTIYLIYCIQVGKNRFFLLVTSAKTVWQLLCWRCPSLLLGHVLFLLTFLTLLSMPGVILTPYLWLTDFTAAFYSFIRKSWYPWSHMRL